jgi:flagellar biosynthesis regulator FlaF
MIRADQLDCQRKAEDAMRMAIAATGFERQIWVRMAVLWQGLGGDNGREKRQGEMRDILR